MPGNSFGTAFRYSTWGESHGPAIGCVIDGVPPRIPLTESEIQVYLDKRRPGGSRFTSQRREADRGVEDAATAEQNQRHGERELRECSDSTIQHGKSSFADLDSTYPSRPGPAEREMTILDR